VTASSLVQLFVAPLNQLGTPYMITGSAAASIYGEPRFTQDIDLVVGLRPADAARIEVSFPGPAFYVPPVEVLAEEIGRKRGGHFNIIHTPSALKADLYVLGEEPLHAWAMERRQHHVVDGHDVFLAPPEYVIVRKLTWFRDGGSEKHLEDIRRMLRVRGPDLDRAVLAQWVSTLGLDAQWSRVEQA
jgi:hypothetical protein